MDLEIPEHIELAFGEADCAGPASEQLILSVEQSLGVSFPPQYRAFLRRYGAALFTGFEIYGLVDTAGNDEPPIWLDLRSALRTHKLATKAKTLIPISDDGGDYTFYLTTESTFNVPAHSVVMYGPGRDGVQVSSNFFDFVRRTASEGVSSLVR
jgi:hypothetical protein